MAAAPDETSWVIEQCKKRLGKDKHGAKAWLITARLLFPSNFHVQVGPIAKLQGLYLIVDSAYPGTTCSGKFSMFTTTRRICQRRQELLENCQQMNRHAH